MTPSEPTETSDRFSLVAGGPFHALLRGLGWVGEDQVPIRRAAIALALLAWLLPALLVVAQSLLDPNYTGWTYFTDLTVYARYLIAIGMMIATERFADGRLTMLVHQFRDAHLVSDERLPGFRAALTAADRLSSSALAEIVLAAIAMVWSGITTGFAVELATSSWEGSAAGSEVTLSWPGLATRFVSNPLFLFLVLRWIWRFLLWSMLLFRISRMRLQLTPLHPDRSAGLGFLAIYPSIFGGFAFALSCVVAASFLKDLRHVEHSPQTTWFAIAGWLIFCLALFLGPLLVFSRQLYLVREKALLDYGRLAVEHHHAFQGKWIERATSGEDLLGNPDVSSTADLNAGFEVVQKMRIIPVDGAATIRLLIAAGLPMLAVVATQIPLGQLVKWIAGAVF